METAIEVSDLHKSYGSIKAVNGISLTVSRGEVLGLLGANDAGKSTTIECILGIRHPDSGKISILDMDPYNEHKKLFE